MKNHVRKRTLSNVSYNSNVCEVRLKLKFLKRIKGWLNNPTNMALLHADTKAKLNTTSENNEKYFGNVVDKFSQNMFARQIRNNGNPQP